MEKPTACQALAHSGALLRHWLEFTGLKNPVVAIWGGKAAAPESPRAPSPGSGTSALSRGQAQAPQEVP